MYTERKLTCSDEYLKKLKARFYAKVDLGADADSCWNWTGGTSNYGKIMLQSHAWTGATRSAVGAHVVSYMIHTSPIPHGFDVAHRCNNKLCVNPKHLYLATRSENNQHAVRDGLVPSTLTDLEVRSILDLWATGDYTQDELAEVYGIGQRAVSRIVNGWAYKWVDHPNKCKEN